MPYAENTRVPVQQSKGEIERTLRKYGADGFGYMTQGGRSVVAFEAHGRRIKFELPNPEASLRSLGKGSGRALTDESISREERRLWRSLANAIKSKLDVVASGISTFEREMLPYTVLGDGRTFSELVESDPRAFDAAALPALMP